MIIIKNITKHVANRTLIFMLFYAHYFSYGHFRCIGCHTSLAVWRSTIMAPYLCDAIFGGPVKGVWSDFKFPMLFQMLLECKAYSIVPKIRQFSADIKSLKINMRCQKDKAVPVSHEGKRGKRGRVQLVLNLGTRSRWEVNFSARMIYPSEISSVPIGRIFSGHRRCSGVYGEEKVKSPTGFRNLDYHIYVRWCRFRNPIGEKISSSL